MLQPSLAPSQILESGSAVTGKIIVYAQLNGWDFRAKLPEKMKTLLG